MFWTKWSCVWTKWSCVLDKVDMCFGQSGHDRGLEVVRLMVKGFLMLLHIEVNRTLFVFICPCLALMKKPNDHAESTKVER